MIINTVVLFSFTFFGIGMRHMITFPKRLFSTNILLSPKHHRVDFHNPHLIGYMLTPSVNRDIKYRLFVEDFRRMNRILLWWCTKSLTAAVGSIILLALVPQCT